jgi:hypothetical protein
MTQDGVASYTDWMRAFIEDTLTAEDPAPSGPECPPLHFFDECFEMTEEHWRIMRDHWPNVRNLART